MGICWSYVCVDRKEYFDIADLYDANPKWPVAPSVGAVLFELFKNDWAGHPVTMLNDCGDYPWEDCASLEDMLANRLTLEARMWKNVLLQPDIIDALDFLRDPERR